MTKFLFVIIFFMITNLVIVRQAHAGIFSALAKVINLSSKSVNKGQKTFKLSKKVKPRDNKKMPKHLDKVLNLGDLYNVVPNNNSCDNQIKNNATKNNRCDSYK